MLLFRVERETQKHRRMYFPSASSLHKRMQQPALGQEQPGAPFKSSCGQQELQYLCHCLLPPRHIARMQDWIQNSWELNQYCVTACWHHLRGGLTHCTMLVFISTLYEVDKAHCHLCGEALLSMTRTQIFLSAFLLLRYGHYAPFLSL